MSLASGVELCPAVEAVALAGEAGKRERLLARRSAILLAGTTAIALVTAAPASAIVINNDFEPDQPPVVTNQFPNVLSINGGSCTGTLISSTVVLTASHCFFDRSGRFDGNQVQVGSGAGTPSIPPSAVILHPGYNPKTTNFANDIAVIVLSRPMNGVTPVNLQAVGPTIAAGTPAYLVGYGGSGTAAHADEEELQHDNRRRAAQTLIGTHGPLNRLPAGVLNSNSPQNAYAAQFRDPHNPDEFNFYNLGGRVPALQGGTAGGDSGGPMFICPKGNGDLSNCGPNEFVQIGEQIGGSQPHDGGGEEEFGYGDISAWTPVLLFTGWIDGNGLAPLSTANPGNFNWSDPNAWVSGMLPGAANVAWLSNPGTITLDINATVSALWITGQQSQLIIAAPYMLTATTNTILSNGILTVNGTLNTPLLGITGGVLNGTGIITGPAPNGGCEPAANGACVSNVGGTVAPGTANALGTLTIVGNYLQGPGGTLQIRLAATGSDQLAVSGQADLGGTLSLVRAGGNYIAGTTYNVLNSGSRVRTFDLAAPLQLTWDLAANPAYTDTGVNVNVVRTATFASIAKTPNEQAIARALDTVNQRPSAPSSPLTTILADIDNGSVDQADLDFDQMDGTVIGNHLVANLAGAGVVQAALDRHLVSLRDGTAGLVQRAAGVNDLRTSYASQSMGLTSGGGDWPSLITAGIANSSGGNTGPDARAGKFVAPDARPYSVWMQGIGAWQNLRGDGNATGLSQNIGGVIGGIDADPFASVLPGLKSGIAFAYTRGNLSSGLDTGSTEAYRIALYALQPIGAAYVEGHVGYSFDRMAASRNISFAGLTASGSTNGSELSATIAAGYRSWVGRVLLEPSAGIAYDRVTRAGYSENGAGSLNLTVADGSLDSLRFSVGGRAVANIDLGQGMLARPELRARYQYDALNPLPASTLALAGVPLVPFTIAGVQPARQAAVLGAGLAISKTEAVSVFGDHNAELRSNQTVQTALAGVRIRW